MRLKDLEEEAYGPEDYEQIKAKQERREHEQLQRAQQKVQQQRSDVARAASN
jgi:hypothetical protein